MQASWCCYDSNVEGIAYSVEAIIFVGITLEDVWSGNWEEGGNKIDKLWRWRLGGDWMGDFFFVSLVEPSVHVYAVMALAILS